MQRPGGRKELKFEQKHMMGCGLWCREEADGDQILCPWGVVGVVAWGLGFILLYLKILPWLA